MWGKEEPGVATERGEGRFSGLNIKPDINNQSYPLPNHSIHIPVRVFKLIFHMDAMNILRKRISGDHTGTILIRTYKLKNNTLWNAWNAFLKFHQIERSTAVPTLHILQ
jgi:hypothetical protein